jgi:hypothetical protein
MGLFTKEKKAKVLPPPPVVTAARGDLKRFIEERPLGTDPGLPTRQITGQTPLQEELVRLAGEQVTGGDFGIAQDVFREAATKGTDVATSPEFEGLRREIDRLSTQARTGIRQRAELGGQLISTPTAGQEAETQQQFDTFLLQEFARLQRQAEQDKLAAAAGLSDLGTERLGQITQAGRIADQERAIEQARNDAIYDQALRTALFPYQEQLQLLQVALSQRDDFMIKGGGLTDLGFAASVAAGAAPGIASQFSEIRNPAPPKPV